MCAVAGSALIASQTAKPVVSGNLTWQYRLDWNSLTTRNALGAGLRRDHLLSAALENATLRHSAALRCHPR